MNHSKTDFSTPGNVVLRWRVVAILTTLIIGFLCHYLYDWTGPSSVAAFFFPVNESVWEHLKLGYWPVIFVSMIEFFWRRDIDHNYIIGRAWGMVTVECTILGIYYSYTSFTKHNILLADIGSFIAGVVLCELLTYRLLLLSPLPVVWIRISTAILVATGILLGTATFYPPAYPLFMDHNTGLFGIPSVK